MVENVNFEAVKRRILKLNREVVEFAGDDGPGQSYEKTAQMMLRLGWAMASGGRVLVLAASIGVRTSGGTGAGSVAVILIRLCPHTIGFRTQY
jgi:hypothetical protein